MKKFRLQFNSLFLLIGIALSISACTKEKQFSGRIIDTSDEPIENATVEIIDERKDTKSASDGAFSLPLKNLKDSSYITLKVSAENFLDRFFTVNNKQLAVNEIVLTRKSELANKILADKKLDEVKSMALKLLGSSNVTAGGGYPEIWIRDLNTFVEAFLKAGGSDNQKNTIKNTLLHFFNGQDQNYFADDGLPEKSEGSIADQYNGDVYKKYPLKQIRKLP
ncbi:MAG: carboxypeptidase regulatory-like domain-containing protein [Chloroflexia bacterium]|nr:carboxypeptidase regulatory-like domain-containing protein [Chloroflexia bacterium]